MATDATNQATQSTGYTLGTVAGTNVTLKSEKNLRVNKTVIRLSGATITMTDNGTDGSGGLKIYDFPAGEITILAATTSLTYAYSSATDSAVISSLGTATAGADATLTSTEADVIASTATAIATSAGTFNGCSTAVGVFNGTATAKDLYLNIATATNPGGNQTMTATGDVTVVWLSAGDV